MPNTNQEITLQQAAATIALKFTERFQKEYPGYAHAIVMMDDLCVEIKTLAQSERDKAWNECLEAVQRQLGVGFIEMTSSQFTEELQKLKR